MKKLIPLTQLPRELSKITANGESRTYDFCYKRILNGIFPVIQGTNGRYAIEADRLPEVAEALGLSLAADIAADIAA